MSSLDTLLDTLKIESHVFHNGQYAGDWAVDTSGSKLMTFHIVSKGSCMLEVAGQRYDLAEGDAVFFRQTHSTV